MEGALKQLSSNVDTMAEQLNAWEEVVFSDTAMIDGVLRRVDVDEKEGIYVAEYTPPLGGVRLMYAGQESEGSQWGVARLAAPGERAEACQTVAATAPYWCVRADMRA
eukprot:SAG22_NODE_1258_length_4983_cov_2.401925_2_plen_108_part_00